MWNCIIFIASTCENHWKSLCKLYDWIKLVDSTCIQLRFDDFMLCYASRWLHHGPLQLERPVGLALPREELMLMPRNPLPATSGKCHHLVARLHAEKWLKLKLKTPRHVQINNMTNKRIISANLECTWMYIIGNIPYQVAVCSLVPDGPGASKARTKVLTNQPGVWSFQTTHSTHTALSTCAIL